MQHSNDRREANKNVSFPVIDNEGYQVISERRSGIERRKPNREDVISAIARDILDRMN
ncbi:MAG: hypothetical protein KZQ70_05855 [gamma proteobacterium symbiont of Lucinoma myriamae]|nr:hypothetical protein [gamma proteobacterium symbiont of Lucinoma myriamae]MCU7817295.1 hypothetical protein [gamma proteobacterium symbiont of Lucinoma myriamae]MCU7832049.1 hypothetical protein [gamma proteobacterium symbiont of Lucinoma myriamae]